MIWDSCLVRAVAHELNQQIQGGRARASTFLREERQAVVYLRESTLIVDLSGGAGWILLKDAQEPPESADPLPARIAEVTTPHDERLLQIRFRRVRGKKPDPTLILELGTNRWNAVWAEGRELKVVRRLRVDDRRPHQIGQPWEPRSGDERAGALGAMSREEWDRLLEGVPSDERRKTLLRSIAHVSSLNVAALLTEGGVGGAGFQAWKSMAEMNALDPQVLELPAGAQPYPWPIPGVTSTPTDSLLGGMLHVSQAAAHPSSKSDWIERYLAQRTKRLEGRRRQLEKQLAKADGAEELRTTGNLILASLHLIPSGVSEVTVPDFEGTPVQLELDPTVKPQAYADQLFARAARLERAGRELPEILTQVAVQLADLSALGARYSAGELPDDEIEKIRASEAAARAAGRKGKQKQAPAEPYRRYKSSGGLEIRVGRGSKRNDELTFHHARPDDVWLHARHSAGAHVVLRWTNKERPPARDLEEAAILAASFSKARGSAHVPVDWTRRKFVRKPKGTRAGSVLLEKAETVFVSPDPELAERLLDD
ncbi:MAG: NFACT RNA binding domain-containing protein [Longimicrobiales bacterium]